MKWDKISSGFQVNHFLKFCVYLRREERISFPSRWGRALWLCSGQGLAGVSGVRPATGLPAGIRESADLSMTNSFRPLQEPCWKPPALLVQCESWKPLLEDLAGMLLDLLGYWLELWHSTPRKPRQFLWCDLTLCNISREERNADKFGFLFLEPPRRNSLPFSVHRHPIPRDVK